MSYSIIKQPNIWTFSIGLFTTSILVKTLDSRIKVYKFDIFNRIEVKPIVEVCGLIYKCAIIILWISE